MVEGNFRFAITREGPDEDGQAYHNLRRDRYRQTEARRGAPMANSLQLQVENTAEGHKVLLEWLRRHKANASGSKRAWL